MNCYMNRSEFKIQSIKENLQITTIKNGGLYSSYKEQRDIHRAFGNAGAPVDDWLQYSPYVEFGALLLFKVKCRNDALNTALLVVKSEALMLAIVFPLKYITKI